MSDKELPKPCWYNDGVWYDADRKPVNNKREDIFTPANCPDFLNISPEVKKIIDSSNIWINN